MKWLLGVLVVLALVYSLGPNPSTPELSPRLPEVPREPEALQQHVQRRESGHKIKPDNEARIIWANDSARAQTPYALVYLHGFSASQAEGEPVHRNIARKFGFNLYLARLAGHGLDTIDPLIHFTVDQYWESVKEALVIGRQLGQRVIVIGTSTGGSAALMLASRYPEIHALVLLSPNIRLFDSKSWILNNPWGLQIARQILGSDYYQSGDERAIYKQYWYARYRLEGIVQLQEMLETCMNESTFEQVKQPVLTLYYYKDPAHQDSVVSVEAIKTMFTQLGTPKEKKYIRPMPHAGNHVLGSYIKSRDLEGVEAEIEGFVRKVTGS